MIIIGRRWLRKCPSTVVESTPPGGSGLRIDKDGKRAYSLLLFRKNQQLFFFSVPRPTLLGRYNLLH